MKPFVAVLCAAAVVVPACWMLADVPKPSDARISWELEFENTELQSIQVRLPGEDKLTTFWFMRYTITNKNLDPQTRQPTEQFFLPEFVMYTDTGQIIRGGYKVPGVVFEEIKKLSNSTLLKDQTSITGKILYGEDNAKEGVAIWPSFDPKAGQLDIFVGGLSGETKEVALPKPVTVKVKDPETGEVKEVTKDKVLLTKTLHLAFKVPGEAASRLTVKPEQTKREWVMR